MSVGSDYEAYCPVCKFPFGQGTVSMENPYKWMQVGFGYEMGGKYRIFKIGYYGYDGSFLIIKDNNDNSTPSSLQFHHIAHDSDDFDKPYNGVAIHRDCVRTIEAAIGRSIDHNDVQTIVDANVHYDDLGVYANEEHFDWKHVLGYRDDDDDKERGPLPSAIMESPMENEIARNRILSKFPMFTKAAEAVTEEADAAEKASTIWSVHGSHIPFDDNSSGSGSVSDETSTKFVRMSQRTFLESLKHDENLKEINTYMNRFASKIMYLRPLLDKDLSGNPVGDEEYNTLKSIAKDLFVAKYALKYIDKSSHLAATESKEGIAKEDPRLRDVDLSLTNAIDTFLNTTKRKYLEMEKNDISAELDDVYEYLNSLQAAYSYLRIQIIQYAMGEFYDKHVTQHLNKVRGGSRRNATPPEGSSSGGVQHSKSNRCPPK